MKTFTLLNWKSLAFILALLTFSNLSAQTTGESFEVDVTTVTYSDVTEKEMDIYVPQTENDDRLRPVILFAHGGAFLGGSKNTTTAEYFCRSFAEKGYITGSFNYTLAASELDLADSLKMIDIVLKAVGDGKAAVRYMRKEATTYGVDTSQIFMGGNSAGGILAMHLGMLDDIGEVPPFFLQLILENGGLDGNAGNEGYSSKIKAVINLAGGLNQVAFMDADDPPFVSCHGDDDGVVPYMCNDVYFKDPIFSLFDLIDLCGSGVLHPYADEVGIQNDLLVFPGADHTPWSVDLSGGDPAMMDEVNDFVCAFLLGQLDDPSVIVAPIINVPDITQIVDFKVFPNPATNGLQVQINDPNTQIAYAQLFDATGRRVSYYQPASSDFYIKRKGISAGLYQLHIVTNQGTINSKVIFE